MARTKQTTAKDPWALVPEELKTAAESMSHDELKKKAGDIAFNQTQLMDAKKADQDLAEKKEAYATANEMYASGTKQNKVSIAYLRSMLESKGGI